MMILEYHAKLKIHPETELLSLARLIITACALTIVWPRNVGQRQLRLAIPSIPRHMTYQEILLHMLKRTENMVPYTSNVELSISEELRYLILPYGALLCVTVALGPLCFP